MLVVEGATVATVVALVVVVGLAAAVGTAVDAIDAVAVGAAPLATTIAMLVGATALTSARRGR